MTVDILSGFSMGGWLVGGLETIGYCFPTVLWKCCGGQGFDGMGQSCDGGISPVTPQRKPYLLFYCCRESKRVTARYTCRMLNFLGKKCCSEPMKLHYSHVTQWRGN